MTYDIFSKKLINDGSTLITFIRRRTYYQCDNCQNNTPELCRQLGYYKCPYFVAIIDEKPDEVIFDENF